MAARDILEEQGTPTRVVATLDRREALEGADAVLCTIIEKKLEVLKTRYQESTGKQFAFDPKIVQAVLARCRLAGARDVEGVLMNELLGTLAQWALE